MEKWFSVIPSAIEIPAPDARTFVFCDFETRNVGGCDLTKAGAWRYAADSATEILCFGYRAGGVDHSWSSTSNSREPLDALATNSDTAFVCFGGFEQAVWSQIMVKRHGFPPIPVRRWIDLRATCSCFALPRSLDKALTALGLPIEKDKEGQRLVRSLSRLNRKTGAYPELTPEIIERIAAYNRIDILALEAMYEKGLGRLSAAEQAVWELDQTINARGIAIDVGFVEAAKRVSDQVMGEAIAEFASLTQGLSPYQVAKTREWLRSRKCALPNLDAETVGEALEASGLPDNVRRVLEIRQIAAATSLKKLEAMLACVGTDGRARGLLQYHGATTGRWSGQLIQPQNFPRPTLEVDIDPEELAAAVRSGDPEHLRSWGKPIDVLVSGLRHALTAADGSMLGAGDFSMIECCVLLALAGQHDKCELIAEGVDVYRDMAATIYGLDRAAFRSIPEDDLSPEETEQRRIGKNGVLSSGYGIGAEGFYRRFLRNIEGGKELAARIVAVYRNTWAPMVPQLWRDLERAARQAMLRPNSTVVAQCGVKYRLTTLAGLPCLVCELTSGKLLHYANARLNGYDKWGRPRWVYNAYRQGQWREVAPYGGQLTENVVSALARELLVHAMFALEAAGYPIVFTVHDEIVVEHPDAAKETIERIMSERPPWAEKLGVPVRAKAWVGKRYAKGAGSVPPRQTATIMPRRLRVLDLYCGAGGVARGLMQAGFSVVGVDILPQPRYPGDEFIQGDALQYLATADLSGIAFIWASPPCQAYSAVSRAPGKHRDADLIAPTRETLKRAGLPYVIENVVGAPLIDPVLLCGSMFGLETHVHPDGWRVERHRLFEASFSLPAPACRHDDRPVCGIYGGHFRDRRRAKGTNHRGGSNIPTELGFKAMGVPRDAMTVAEISDAIPPAYSKFIAEKFLEQFAARDAAA
jgi:DNA polymerase